MKRSKEEIMNLYHDNEKLIYSTIHRRFNSPRFLEAHGLTMDDLVQFGRMGLHRACASYDSSKGTAFSTHAINCIYFIITRECKRDSLGSNKKWSFDLLDKTSLDKIVYTDGNGNDFPMHSFIEYREEGFDELMEKDMYQYVLDNSTERLATIISMRFDEHTYAEIGETLNTSHQNIRQILRTHKSKIQDLVRSYSRELVY